VRKKLGSNLKPKQTKETPSQIHQKRLKHLAMIRKANNSNLFSVRKIELPKHQTGSVDATISKKIDVSLDQAKS